jgi:hypothetical protein
MKKRFFGPRHRVSFCLDYSEGGPYLNWLLEWNQKHQESLLINETGRANISKKTKLCDVAIRQEVRKTCIKRASVMILLCGPKVKENIQADWMIDAAMVNDMAIHKKTCGILVINLPFSHNHVRFTNEIEWFYIARGKKGTPHQNVTRADFERDFPDMPSRIIDCFVKNNCPIAVVDWRSLDQNMTVLFALINEAYEKRDSMFYDLPSAPLKRRISHYFPIPRKPNDPPHQPPAYLLVNSKMNQPRRDC